MSTKEQIEQLNEELAQIDVRDVAKTPEFFAGLLAHRCYQDDEFRREFLADPRAALEASGEKFAGDLEIVAVENDENTWHVPVPSDAVMAKLRKAKISDEQMSQLSGGEVVIAMAVTAGVVGTVGAAVTAASLGVAGHQLSKKRKKGKKK